MYWLEGQDVFMLICQIGPSPTQNEHLSLSSKRADTFCPLCRVQPCVV